MNPPLEQQIAAALQRMQKQIGDIHSSLVGLRRRCATLDAHRRLAQAGRRERLPLEFRSQYGEDVVIYELFGGKLEGFFIEVGAYDGVGFSATYALEALGWQGLLVEANPGRAAACAKNRPHSRTVHAACSRKGSSGEATFSLPSAESSEMLAYLSTNPAHLERVRRESPQISEVRVPLTSLDELLAGHQGPIDAAVIDVEGGEEDLLHGFDLERWKPRALIIENNPGPSGRTIQDIMKNTGYILAAGIVVNLLYIRQDDRELLDRVSRIV